MGKGHLSQSGSHYPRKHKTRMSLARDSQAAKDNHTGKYTWADFAHHPYGNIIQEHYEHTKINLQKYHLDNTDVQMKDFSFYYSSSQRYFKEMDVGKLTAHRDLQM